MPDSDYEQIFTYSITQRKLVITILKKKIYEMYATSGRGEYLNNPAAINKKYYGPIPIGDYVIYPKEMDNPSMYWDYYVRNKIGDWGDWRILLHPLPGTNTFSRDAFYLHGGSIEGSAGCIDIGGFIWGNRHTDFVRDVIIKTKKTILLRVTE